MPLKMEAVGKYKVMTKKINPDERRGVLVLLSDEEKMRFEQHAKDMGWSLSKYIRICGVIFDLLVTKKISNFDMALEQALLSDTKRIDNI